MYFAVDPQKHVHVRGGEKQAGEENGSVNITCIVVLHTTTYVRRNVSLDLTTYHPTKKNVTLHRTCRLIHACFCVQHCCRVEATVYVSF